METRRLSRRVFVTLLILLEIYSTHCEEDECHDIDKCACRKNSPKCTTAMEGTNCPYTDKICKGMKFKKDQCRRKNTYISYRAALCKIEDNKGDCKPEKVLMGVNCGGPEHTDSNGITYKAYSDAPAKFEKNSLNEETEVEEFSGAPEEDKSLYESYIWGDGDKINDTWIFWACAEWWIPFKEGGDYEVTVKTLEPLHSEPLKRSFSITLNKKPVAIELDIFRMTGKKGAALDIIIPFKISAKLDKIEIFGQPEIAFKDKKVRLAFCHGVCKTTGGDLNYVVSAFSVTKVKLSNEDEEDNKEDVTKDITERVGDEESPAGKKGKGKPSKKPGEGGAKTKENIIAKNDFDDTSEAIDDIDMGKEKPWPAGTNKKKGIPDDDVEIVDCDDEGNEVSSQTKPGKPLATKKPGKGGGNTKEKLIAKNDFDDTSEAIDDTDKGKGKPWPAGTNKKKGIPDEDVELVDCDDEGNEVSSQTKIEEKKLTTKKPGRGGGSEITKTTKKSEIKLNELKPTKNPKDKKGKEEKGKKTEGGDGENEEASGGGEETTTEKGGKKGKKTTTKKPETKDKEKEKGDGDVEFVDCDDAETTTVASGGKDKKGGGKKKTTTAPTTTEEPDEGPIGGRSVS